MSADDDADERMARHLDVLRRGGYRTGTGMTRPPEPETVYPSHWLVPTRKRDQ